MRKFLGLFLLACCSCMLMAQKNVIDEIVWVVGDEAILKSDVEAHRLYDEDQRFDGDPYCVIPEQLAIQKLYLHQAKLDSIEANESQVIQQTERWMNYMVGHIGSKEKLEEYFNKKFSQIKDERKETFKEQQIVEQMQHKIIGDVKLTPSEVRKYFNQLPQDSLPYIPATVEIQIITMEPKIPFEETDAIKARLRDFTEQINSGKIEFSTLARLYSEDTESATRGGELGFTGKGLLLPEFANVAFNLNDPKKVSKIVETEYGFHIIQLIEKRGDRINCRHILLKPKPSEKELDAVTEKLDTLYVDLQAKKVPFEEAVIYVSYDKDTRNNKGLMVNKNMESNHYSTPKFELQELPQEIGKVVYDMEVGEISRPFRMINPSNQKEVVAIVKLKSKVEGHKANISDDFQALKSIVEQRKKVELLNKWIAKKQADTYVRISKGWDKCDFKYPGWIKD
ncbi:peptidylprolyl isomerase [Parabacteroides pacaensis]|uniref:peptidylprolyl isomerase n=1 Tax=Parabacteroides pacaensis TaxID=2086575 RepID=UPI000D113D98|nr:peptidylprolyl isomerase [Parabacteroides pacaensis]